MIITQKSLELQRAAAGRLRHGERLDHEMIEETSSARPRFAIEDTTLWTSAQPKGAERSWPDLPPECWMG